MMDSPVKPIAIVQGAESAAVQQLLRDFVSRRQASLRIAGVIEEVSDLSGRACGAGRLLNIVDGSGHMLFQELGKGSDACSLDPTGVVLAGEAARRDILAGCDLAVLSKFGKLEAENGSGLMGAFVAAMEVNAPILTSVSPRFASAWKAFAAPLFVTLPANAGAIDEWWEAISHGSVELGYSSVA